LYPKYVILTDLNQEKILPEIVMKN